VVVVLLRHVVLILIPAQVLVGEARAPHAFLPVDGGVVLPAEHRRVVAVHADILHKLAARFVLVLVAVHPGAVELEGEVARR
jgi:hypothetical protein